MVGLSVTSQFVVDRAVTELLCIAEVPFYLPCVCDAVAADVLCRAAHRRVWH